MVTAMALVCSALLVMLNAFFVASEFAIVKIRPTRLETLAGSGSRRARLVLGMMRRLDVYLSANQLGITLASLALGWIGGLEAPRTPGRLLFMRDEGGPFPMDVIHGQEERIRHHRKYARGGLGASLPRRWRLTDQPA